MADVDQVAQLIEQLAPVCRKHGVRRVVAAGVELEFAPATGVEPALMKQFKEFMEKGIPSEEEALMWSAPGFVPPAERQGAGPAVARARRGG